MPNVLETLRAGIAMSCRSDKIASRLTFGRAALGMSVPRRPRVRAWPRVALLVGLGFSAVNGLLLALAWALTNQADGYILSGGKRRSYLLHVPASYDPAAPVPLVISIHGFAEWPAHQVSSKKQS